MAIRRRRPEHKKAEPRKKKPERKKPARKHRKGVNPGGPNIPAGGSDTGSTGSGGSAPASSVVASEDMSQSPDYGTVTGTTTQDAGNAPDTADAIFSTGPGVVPHYHATQPAAEEYALATQQTQTSEVSPI